MKEKILIVDDEKDIARMVDYNLRKEGFRTSAICDGEDALGTAKPENPDPVIF